MLLKQQGRKHKWHIKTNRGLNHIIYKQKGLPDESPFLFMEC